jgi:uroporphyrinogen-III decarboxylase
MRTPVVMRYKQKSNTFNVNAGCAIPAETPSEHIRRLVDLTRNH